MSSTLKAQLMLGFKKQNQNLFLMVPHPHVFGQHKLNLVVNKKKS